MDGAAVIFAAQAAQARADLLRIEVLLSDARLGDVHQRIRDRFQVLVRRTVADLDRLAEQAARRGATQDIWTRFGTQRVQVARISSEALAFVQGIQMRASGLDGGVGLVTDRMLAGLAERSGLDRSVMVAFDDREFLDHTVGMVRLRFPDTSVWGLPILVHELGHHVAATLPDANPQLRGTQPVLGYVSAAADQEARAGGDRAQARSWLQELFADVFATFALGAAYPLAVIFLRAVPDQYADATATHPSWRRRVLTMLETLAAMAESAADPSVAMAYRLMAQKRVLPAWRGLVGDEAPDDAAAKLARRQATDMVDLLSRNTPDRLRYRPPPSIERLVALFEDVATHPLHGPEELLEPPAGTEVAHVLNAAWRCRLAHPASGPDVIDRISRAALHCCAIAET